MGSVSSASASVCCLMVVVAGLTHPTPSPVREKPHDSRPVP